MDFTEFRNSGEMSIAIEGLSVRPGEELAALTRFGRSRRAAASYAAQARRMQRRQAEIDIIRHLYAPLPWLTPAREGIEELDE